MVLSFTPSLVHGCAELTASWGHRGLGVLGRQRRRPAEGTGRLGGGWQRGQELFRRKGLVGAAAGSEGGAAASGLASGWPSAL